LLHFFAPPQFRPCSRQLGPIHQRRKLCRTDGHLCHPRHLLRPVKATGPVAWHTATDRSRRNRAPLPACVPRCRTRKAARSWDPPPAGWDPIHRARRSPCADPLPQLPDTPAGHLRPGSASSRFPHNAGQHANFPLIKSSFDFQPRFPSKSKPITAMLSTGPSLKLHKARFSGPAPFSQPTLKIEEAHSLADGKTPHVSIRFPHTA
jgi:hypothetical protein